MTKENAVGWVTAAYGAIAAPAFLAVELVDFSRTGLGLLDVLVPWWTLRTFLAVGIATGGVLILRGDKRGLEYVGLCSGLLCLFPFWTLFAMGPSTVMSRGLGSYLGQLLLSAVIYSIPLGTTLWCWRQKCKNAGGTDDSA